MIIVSTPDSIVNDSFIQAQKAKAIQRWRTKAIESKSTASSPHKDIESNFDYLFRPPAPTCLYILDDGHSCDERRSPKSSYCSTHHSLCYERTKPLKISSILQTRPKASSPSSIRLNHKHQIEIYD